MLGAIEAGGTKMVLARARTVDDVLESASLPTRDPTATLAAILEFFGDQQLDALCIASFGPLDVHRASPTYGRILRTPKPGWEGFDWLAALRPLAGDRIVLETDVGAAAWAEAHDGAAAGCRNLAYVTVGTGIGVGLIEDGRVVHGTRHPELGHLRVRRSADDPFAGSCPFHGDCLEGLASGSAVRAATGRPGDELPEDHPAWTRVADALAELVATLCLSVSPERIVFGGGVAHQLHLLPRIRAGAAERLAGYLAPGPSDDMDALVVAAAHPHAGLRGALLLASLS